MIYVRTNEVLSADYMESVILFVRLTELRVVSKGVYILESVSVACGCNKIYRMILVRV